MKKVFCISVLLLAMFLSINGQAPMNFNYQAVARDASGAVMANQNISLQIAILIGNETGNSVYIEEFSQTTNDIGLISVAIGTGNVVSGDFTNVDWGSDKHFLKVWLNGTVMGTSQILSVPYAQHANYAETTGSAFSGSYTDLADFPADLADGDDNTQLTEAEVDAYADNNGYLSVETDPVYVVSMAAGITATDTANWHEAYRTRLNGVSMNLTVYDSAQIKTLSPATGSIIYNRTEDIIMVYAEDSWRGVYTFCWPQPTQAEIYGSYWFDDGRDTTTINASVPLQANETGMWSIVTGGNGGSFADSSQASTLFTGNPCESYEIRWTITNECGNSVTEKYIGFSHSASEAYGGDNFYSASETSVTLGAYPPEAGHGIGTWSISAGEGGSFSDVHDPKAVFSGTSGIEYGLLWTIESSCETNSYEVIVNFGALFEPSGTEWSADNGLSSSSISDVGISSSGKIVIGGRTSDNSIAGHHGADDFFVSVHDAEGNQEWVKAYGGSDNESTWFGFKVASDGFLLCGETSSTDGDFPGYNGVYCKLDENGDIVFANNISEGMVGTSEEVDDGYILAIHSGDVLVRKIDKTGALVWENTYGGTGAENAYTSAKAPDNGIYIASYSNSSDGDVSNFLGGTSPGDYWLIRVSNTGALLWEKSLGSPESESWISEITEADDGGVILVGGSYAADGSGQQSPYMVKLDSDGNILWEKRVQPDPGQFADVRQVGQKIIAICEEVSTHKIWCFDNDGNELWDKDSYDLNQDGQSFHKLLYHDGIVIFNTDGSFFKLE